MDKRDFLKSFFTDYWKYMTVSAACKLNVFDVLVSGEKTSLEISECLSIKLENIEMLLNGLLAIDFLDKVIDIWKDTDRASVLWILRR